MKNIPFTFFIILISLLSCKNQSLKEGQFSRQQLLDDLDSLYADINEIHPDMYANISKEEFDAEFRKIKSSVKKPMDAAEFYNLTAPLIVKIRDGHTSLQLNDSIYINTDKLLYPLSVKVPNDSTIIITKNLSTEKNIPVDAEINSINSIPAKELIATCLNYASGEMMFYRLSKIPYLFTNTLWYHYKYENFDINYTYNDTVHTQIVKGIPYSERYKKDTIIIKNNESAPDYSFKIIGNVGIMDFRQMIDLNKFSKFTDSVFTIIKNKNINNLIVDMRHNGGGNSKLGDNLFQYISPVPFKQFGKTVVKYSKGREEFYRKYAREFFMHGATDSAINEMIGNRVYGTIDTLPEGTPEELIGNPLRYKGNVYMLTSHNTFSSAASTAWAFKYFGMGKVIGQETGQPGVSYGDIILRWLPNTKMTYTVSHKKFYLYGATDDNFHGTIPDYDIPSEEALEYTMKLIAEQ